MCDLSGCGLGGIVRYVTHDLPVLNIKCRDGADNLESWITSSRAHVAVGANIAPSLNELERLTLLQSLGFILASGERHAQAAGLEPGWIVGNLPGLERGLLIAAGNSRPPVLTADLYWLMNDGQPPLSFTGEPHEYFFISAVRTQAALREIVNRQLRALLDGRWNPALAEGARMLRAASSSMAQAHGQYLDFRRGPQGFPLMTPEQFNEMRVWLASTVIAGRSLAGPNAAYIPEMVVTDFLLGTADAEYGKYVDSFDIYQSPEGRALIAGDRGRTSLVLVIAHALGLNAEEFDGASSEQLSSLIRNAPRSLCWTLDAFKELVDQFIGSSGAHVGLVHVYLEKYASELSEEDLDRMPVKPTQGTGGHSHDHTRRLHDMRRRSPRIRKLLTAIRQASASPEAA